MVRLGRKARLYWPNVISCPTYAGKCDEQQALSADSIIFCMDKSHVFSNEDSVRINPLDGRMLFRLGWQTSPCYDHILQLYNLCSAVGSTDPLVPQSILIVRWHWMAVDPVDSQDEESVRIPPKNDSFLATVLG